MNTDNIISAVDLFCGAGGLTYGLSKAGIQVKAGIDIDEQARYAYEKNNPEAKFYNWDLTGDHHSDVAELFETGQYRLLAGCAPCQPFSKLTIKEKRLHNDWDLLIHFGRYIEKILPEFVTMENVPGLASRGKAVFNQFLAILTKNEYHVDYKIINCREYGVPQSRERLVLLASRLGKISVPDGTYRNAQQWKTVRRAIENLPPLKAGEEDPTDRLHCAPTLSPLNLERMRMTKSDGGTRRDWPDNLVLDCHKKVSGHSYSCNYGRMWWDKPAPTMTTHCTGIGNGRFGHPEQDRSITLREAMLLQSFPRDYEFCSKQEIPNRTAIQRMVGNAVPPKLAETLGGAIMSRDNNL